jgi:hypothetical protein
MPFHLQETFRHIRITRLLVCTAILIVAFVVQYRLTTIPLVGDINQKKQFSPAPVNLNREKLVIEEPSVNSAGRVLLAYEGRKNQLVDVHFPTARLADETIQDLLDADIRLPTAPGRIDYSTPESRQAPAAGEQCRTSLQILLPDSSRPSAIRFYQPEAAGAGHRRNLELEASGGDLLIEIGTATPTGENAQTQGCAKMLTVAGQPGVPLTAPLSVSIIVPAGSTFYVNFQPLNTDAAGGDLAESFQSPTDDKNKQPAFQAKAVSIVNYQTGDSILGARSTAGGALLNVGRLAVDFDKLQVEVSGTGELIDHGEVVTVDFLERLQRHPFAATIVGGLNAALIAWFIRLITKKGATTPVAGTQSVT